MNTAEIVSVREKKFAKINRVCIIAYYAIMLVLIVRYAIQKDTYHLGTSLGTLAIPVAIWLFYKITRLKSVEQLNFMILTYTFLAYPLGTCLDVYRIIQGFDKVAHGLSGVFVSVICLILFYALKPGHTIEPKDAPLAIVFTFMGSMAVAGLWEIGEYTISLIVRMDLQKVEATGVADSMQDMIVCMAGTIATLPFVKRLTDGRQDIITGSVTAFVELNMK